MSIHYIYDGTFDGLLTCIYEAYYGRDKPEDILSQDQRENNFLVKERLIPTDDLKAKKVYKAIEEKISLQALKRVFYAYLSQSFNKEIKILKYLQIGFKIGSKVDRNLANDHVLEIDKIYHKVSRERHRMAGLIRFKELNNKILYASIEPDHNIIGLVAPHFAGRIANENWIIHDIRRKIGVFYNKEQWVIREITTDTHIFLREDEEEYQKLWNAYCDSIAIKEKINPKLQKSNMPKKYWKHLIEKQS